MSTITDVDRERRRAQHAARSRYSRHTMMEVCLEALDRALDAMKHGDHKLAEREVEYVREKLEKVA